MRKDPTKPSFDIHQAITDKIIAAIAAGAGTWQMPWHRPGTSFSRPINALTGQTYRGSNILSLWIDADEKRFPHQTWATYRQWSELGAQVRGGEKSSLIVKYGEWVPKDARGDKDLNTQDDVEAGKRLYAKAAHVFNVAQVDGYAMAAPASPIDRTEKLAHVDAFVAATGAAFREGGTRAYYRPRASDGSGDFIQMPPRALFTGTATSTPTEAYEATRLHELVHWTGADHRLQRDLRNRFGDQRYAAEELVAELGAAFLCAELAITNTPRADHAQYVAHWLAVLKHDNRAIFTAAALASAACGFLGRLQPGATHLEQAA